MAEKLGDAVLELRTDDTKLARGLLDARRKAEQTMNDLAAAQARATTENAQAKAAYKAGEITLEAYNRRLLENKVALAAVQAQHAAAQKSLSGFEGQLSGVTQMAGAQRQGMQQLSFQLNDIATMYALGARPMQIFASQSGQVIQSIQMMTGGTSRLAAFLGGPWGLAITSAFVVLTPFIAKLFEGEAAMKAVEFASDKMADAQSILGSVIDTTTGKINTQSQALWALARAQAAAGRIAAEREAAQARSQLADVRRGSLQLQGGMGGGLRLARQGDGTQDVVGDFMEGRIGATFAIGSLRSRRDAGRITDEAFLKAVEPIVNSQLAQRNIEVFSNLEGALNGDQQALQGFLQRGSARGGGGSPDRSGPRQRTDAERADDFAGQTFAIERETLQARLALANSAQERADVQRDLLALERDNRIAEIERSDLTREMKNALIGQVQAVLGTAPKFDEQGNLIVSANRGLEGEIIARELANRQLQQSQQLGDAKFQADTEALQNALALADTEQARKEVSLRLYDAALERERIRLQEIIDAEAIGAVTKEEADLARARLAGLKANAAMGRAAVARQNETEVERYTRNLNATPEMINEAIDGIKIDGLEALNDGLTRAIMGAESLGDVFSRVADQIIADLLRIAIQQTIIRPLATLLFGGTGGGGGFFSTLLAAFVGGRAMGGPIPAGKFAVVGEQGPELAYASGSGLGIMSNGESRRLISTQQGGGTSVSIPITIDATGADAAALERVRSEISQLREELPERIVRTVQDASDRRIINVGGPR
jgi:hypothetical protein